MASGSRIPAQALSLKQFMMRQEVLKLYREVLRTSRKVDPNQRTEIVQWARTDIEQHRSQSNEDVIKRLVMNGRQMLKELQSTIKKTE